MAVSIKYVNDFIVGGHANTQLTPNFRLREYQRTDGTILIHRELVAAVQLLRESLDAAVRISDVQPRAVIDPVTEGLAVTVSANDQEALLQKALQMAKSGYFQRVEAQGDQLYLEIPDPDNLPPIAPQLAFDCGVRVTAAFETSGDPYQQVTGNFDGAGLSFGPIQCNLKTGTLQELFRRMRGEDSTRLERCFGNQADYLTFWRILDGSRSAAVAWADRLSTGRDKHGFSQPWNGYLQTVGRDKLFQSVMLRYAYDKYGKLLMSALAFASGISPLRIDNLRCLAALYDMGVQQGSLHKARSQIIRRVAAEQPQDQFTLTRILVEERAKKASPRWRADCLSRRLSILQREPVSVTLNGETASRSNPCSYLLRNCPVRSLENYLAS